MTPAVGLRRTESGTIVSTDDSAYVMIKRERARQKERVQVKNQVDELQGMVLELMRELKELKGV